MNELITIKGVRGILNEDGNPELHLEDVARGLGFIQEKNGKAYIRWERLNSYLEEFGFPTDGESDFIPENIFYKLCFKAESKMAIEFQDKVTDEILPSIRKHGAYLAPQKIEEILLNPDTIIKLATDLKAEREQRQVLEIEVRRRDIAIENRDAIIEEQIPAVRFADSVSTSKDSILVGEMAKILNQNGIETGEKRLYQWLRDNKFLISRKGTDWNMPTQKSVEMDLFEIAVTSINHSNGETSLRKTSKVTGKGQRYFVDRFLKDNPKPLSFL